ncbi:hypothetical protein Mapa_014508 [Marchantia paleacea]|nr:hypothetical protein Mapa_014508 [Marchantia paleacea]
MLSSSDALNSSPRVLQSSEIGCQELDLNAMLSPRVHQRTQRLVRTRSLDDGGRYQNTLSPNSCLDPRDHRPAFGELPTQVTMSDDERSWSGRYQYDSSQSEDSGDEQYPPNAPPAPGPPPPAAAAGAASTSSHSSRSWRGGYMFDDTQSSSEDEPPPPRQNLLALPGQGRGRGRGRGGAPQWRNNLPGQVWPPLPAEFFEGVSEQFYVTFGVRPRPPPLFLPAPLIQPPYRDPDDARFDPFLHEDYHVEIGTPQRENVVSEEEEEAIYNERLSPRVDQRHPFNLNRDIFLAEDGENVPHFWSWVEREQWIREKKLLAFLREREDEQQAIESRRENIERDLPPLTEAELRQKRMDDLLLGLEMTAESSDESGLSDPRRERTPNRLPDSFYEDTATSTYRRHTFEPALGPVRPAEFPQSNREFGNEEPYNYPYYCVLVGEINPDFESQRGDVLIIHPGHMGRGRQFPVTGFIHTVRGPQDFRRYGLMHGDLNLRIGRFISVVAEFIARPSATMAYYPLQSLLLHSYVDLNTRSRVDPARYPSLLSRYLGEQDEPWDVTLSTLRHESTVRNLRPGTDVTSHFLPRLGDALILPGAWQDNFNHKENFRRSLVRWYETGGRSLKFIVPGVMVVRPCVDMEFRGSGYLNAELMQATHRADPDFRWGYVELYSLGAGNWFYWGRDIMLPSFSVGKIPKCVFYCADV